jgi:enamine deaminase RidA (YjgF/YER057c/UK114 family)
VKVGDILYISGCIPLNLKGEVVCPGDVKEQAVQVLANLMAITEAGGSQVDKIIKTIVSIPRHLANLVNLYAFSTGVP